MPTSGRDLGTRRPSADPEPTSVAAPPVARLRPALLRWYRRNRRDLPWRNTRDPYAIWLSEIMLQQTQVATVLPYYERFLERFPDPASLAAAGEEEVLGRWSGLGYYRRARALHAGARVVMERHGGRLPADAEALRELPGIGAYTAGAIASIAFGLAEPILDGNVHRVFSRWLALPGSGHRRPREERPLWELARRLVQGADPGDLNQALMELGALVCTPRKPACDSCPVRRHCEAFRAGDPERFPARRAAPGSVKVRVGIAWVQRGERVLVERDRPAGPLRGVWDLPAVEQTAGSRIEAALRSGLNRRHGLEIDVAPRQAHVSHGIMNRRLRLDIHPCRIRRGAVARRPGLRWIDPTDLGEIAVSGATHKICRLMTGR